MGFHGKLNAGGSGINLSVMDMHDRSMVCLATVRILPDTYDQLYNNTNCQIQIRIMTLFKRLTFAFKLLPFLKILTIKIRIVIFLNDQLLYSNPNRDLF